MAKRVYLNVPYSEKDEVKSKGARFDWNIKRWFVTEETKDRFTKWLPTSSVVYEDLSDEQKVVIDSAKAGSNILVDACIGSGKTTTIQVLCNELKGVSILYLTFNRLLKLDAQAKITSPNTFVTNYDGFAYKCLKEAGLPCDVERNIRLFNQYKPATPEYDVLIMDEYQDIREDIADMLHTLKERNPFMQIIAVGDMQQKIYNFTALDVQAFMLDFLGEDCLNLSFTQCFRLSADHAQKLGDLWDKPIVGRNTNSKTVVVNTLEEIVEFLQDKEPKDILVLGARAGDTAAVLNALESEFPDKFNKSTVYASIKEGEDTYTKDRNDVAIFTTFDSSKGLERKYCVVLDWSLEYWELRKGQPDAQYDVLRNLFLVGASRGKAVNMFYDFPSNEGHPKRGCRNLLSNLYYGRKEEDIPYPSRFDGNEPLKVAFEKPYNHDKGYSASSMYEFLYAEDVAACSNLIKVTTLRPASETIDVQMNDENIDLSMCVGTLVEAGYFKGYNLQRDRELALVSSTLKFTKARTVHYTNEKGEEKTREVTFFDSSATDEDKVLMLAATTTSQNRYIQQVASPLITPEDAEKIKERLSSEFSVDEEVQTTVEIDFLTVGGEYRMHGICDVVKGDVITELKFTSELKETHKLQLAFQLCAHTGNMRGRLWNVKTGEMLEVEVPNKRAFLEQTVKAISKRNLQAVDFYTYEPNHTWLNYNPQRDGSNVPVRKEWVDI